MKLLMIFLLFVTTASQALEVDEKLTVRILRTSETRKTVMLNRGTEDGLVEGDHARFLVTAGIVARGVCVKVSPTRSVWSLYRLVNADFIVNDSVMTIKITPPVKVTKDETQALVQEDTPTRVSVGDATELGIPLAEGAQDLQGAGGVDEDLKAILQDETPSIIPERNLEVYGLLNIHGLTANSKTDTGSNSFNSSQSSQTIGAGVEWYSRKEREWYSRFSLQGQFNFMRQDSQAFNGATAANDLTEFAFGVNWHPTKMPSQTMAFIPYFHLGLNIGSVKSTYTPGTENSGGPDLSSNGSSQGFSVGFGYKFYTSKGFGARAILDYYMRTEKYKEDQVGNAFNKTVGGPRLLLGFGYRF